MKVINFWVDVEDGAGSRYGPGPLRPRTVRVKRPLSKAGEFSFEVLASDPNIGVLAEKRVAVCRYVGAAGAVLEFGGGVIDKIGVKIGQDGLLTFVVSGNDLARELNYRSVGSLALESGGTGVTNGPIQIMGYAPAGWTISGGTTSLPVYAGFDGESVLSALCRVGEHIGEHWRLGSGREIVWLGPVSSFLPAGLRVVQQVNDGVGFEGQTEVAVVLSLEEIRDAAEVMTRIMPRGSGNGGVILTLEAATDAAPAGYTLNKAGNYLKNDAAEAAYGRIEKVLDTKDIGPLSNTSGDIQAAANALLQAAYQHLERYAAPMKAYRIGLWANSMVLPGTMLRVIYRVIVDGTVIYDLDDELIVLGVEHSLDSTGLHTSSVEVGTIDRHPLSDTEVVLGQVQNGRIFAAHQQLSASVDTLTWRDELDDDHSANFRFWLGDEYTSILQAILRFQIRPMRSTTKAAASGGGQTATGGSHLHTTTIPAGTPNFTDIGWYVDGFFVTPISTNGNALLMQAGVQENHLHTINAHLHTLLYGIYEENGTNTVSLADLAITLNGEGDLRGFVTEIGDGWYALDLTSFLVDSVNRPSRENNVVTIATGTAKTGRIEAQLTVRGVIQATKYS